MRAMILAAGRGERMGTLTASRPKPLLEVAGRTLIERHLDALARTSVREVVINVAHGGDLIRRALGDGARWQLSIRYSDEGETALETAGGIIRALPWLGDDPFLVLSADVVSDFDLNELIGAPQRPTLIMVENPPHHSEGDFGLASTGLLTRDPPLLTYGGIALLAASLFEDWPAGRRPLRPVLDAAIDRQALYGRRHAGRWIDVGTPARLAAASELVASAAGDTASGLRA